jgi:hypothetical protein
MGAIPWLFLQIALVIILIVWPESVTYWLDTGTVMNQQQVDDALKNLSIPGMGPSGPGNFGLPGLDAPPVIKID